MNDLRWGSLATKHNLPKLGEVNNIGTDENWEWFVETLELDRIRLTLSQFPVADTLEPAPFSGVECGADSDNEVKRDEKVESSSDSEDQTDDDSIMSGQGSNATPQANTRGPRSLSVVRHDLWRGAGEDLRYSPGFILPLILAALESRLPNDDITCDE